MIKYAIDTCSFTQLRRVYPDDVFPSIWEKIDDLASNEIICSCEEVYHELVSQDDVLATWAKQNKSLFLPIDETIQITVKNILKTHPGLLNIKKGKSGADPFLIATAKILKCTLVTEENPGNVGGPPKIPNVCSYYGIEYINILEMLRREGLRL